MDWNLVARLRARDPRFYAARRAVRAAVVVPVGEVRATWSRPTRGH